MDKYRSKQTVEARKVETEDGNGETVVTSQGGVTAAEGSYVVHFQEGDTTSVHVVDAEDFENAWEREGRASTGPRETPERESGTEDGSEDDSEDSSEDDSDREAESEDTKLTNLAKKATPTKKSNPGRRR